MSQPPEIDPRCASIDEVIDKLDTIIAWARQAPSRDGYFAALYRNVTVRVKQGVAAGMFDDGPRMERLDVRFAGRYLEAWTSFRHGRPTSRCWASAFEAADQWRPTLLQHLLLGMNAHINFDLGIAAAQTCPGEALVGLRQDFDRINDVLASLLREVQHDLDALSPWIGLLDRIGGRVDDVLVNFSIGLARAQAWRVAEHLAPLESTTWAPRLEALDRDTTHLAHAIQSPGILLSLGLLAVRSAERSTIPHAIDVLGQVAEQASPAVAPVL